MWAFSSICFLDESGKYKQEFQLVYISVINHPIIKIMLHKCKYYLGGLQ